jgi:uncharacterized membrane protein YoaK (UPF0700 family)
VSTGRLRTYARSLRAAVSGDEYARRVTVGWAAQDDPPRRSLPLIVLLLTFTTGLIDAVSYLGLGRVFSGIQTGNLVVLGFALAGSEEFTIAGPALSLVAFFGGAALGGQLAIRWSRRHRRWFAIALTSEGALLALAALAAAGLTPGAMGDWHTYAVIALLSSAMGLRSATIRRLSAPEVSTTVLTSTITSLATDAGTLASAPGRHAWQVSTVAARLLGAVAGALLLPISLMLPIALVAGLTVVTAVAYVTPVFLREVRRRRAAERRPPRET